MAALFGLWRAGCAAAPLHERLGPAEVAAARRTVMSGLHIDNSTLQKCAMGKGGGVADAAVNEPCRPVPAVRCRRLRPHLRLLRLAPGAGVHEKGVRRVGRRGRAPPRTGRRRPLGPLPVDRAHRRALAGAARRVNRVVRAALAVVRRRGRRARGARRRRDAPCPGAGHAEAPSRPAGRRARACDPALRAGRRRGGGPGAPRQGVGRRDSLWPPPGA